MTAKLDYTYDQVKPILDRFMAHLNPMNAAALLSYVQKANDGQRAFVFTIEDKYKLVVLPYSIILERDGIEIHNSRTQITHLSRILRNSPSFK